MGCLHSKTTHLPSPDDPSSQLDPGPRSPSLFLSLLHARTHTPTLHVFLFFVLDFEAIEIKLPLCFYQFFFWLFGYLGFEANGLQDGFLLSHSFDSAEFLWGFEASRVTSCFFFTFFFFLTLRLISDFCLVGVLKFLGSNCCDFLTLRH
jgi:hypothetical protein